MKKETEETEKRNKKFAKAIEETKRAILSSLEYNPTPMSNSVLYNNISSSSNIIDKALEQLKAEDKLISEQKEKFVLWSIKGKSYVKNS